MYVIIWEFLVRKVLFFFAMLHCYIVGCWSTVRFLQENDNSFPQQSWLSEKSAHSRQCEPWSIPLAYADSYSSCWSAHSRLLRYKWRTNAKNLTEFSSNITFLPVQRAWKMPASFPEISWFLNKFHRDQLASWSPQMLVIVFGNQPKIPESFRFRNYSDLPQTSNAALKNHDKKSAKSWRPQVQWWPQLSLQAWCIGWLFKNGHPLWRKSCAG